ncbi:MAG TPA: lipid-binding SYLF domain-containing protein [Candidatus Dormibacteraeota bacterium]|nr:lipid-binding SYLF domain-containing protein [Candidatus Dormibacteraeota bacterium]
MKTIILGLTLLGLVSSALAVDQAELDNRIRMLTAKFDEMQQKPDKRIPAETLSKARGIVLLDRTKAGFIFAYQGGGGVALVKNKSGNWSPAAFLTASEASLGAQIGGEENFFVFVFMDTNSLYQLTGQNSELGSEVRSTAGNDTAGVGSKVTSPKQYNNVLVYDDRKGLYAGAFVKGGAILADDKANQIYYGRFLTMKNILFDKKVKPTETATDLAKKIKGYSEK